MPNGQFGHRLARDLDVELVVNFLKFSHRPALPGLQVVVPKCSLECCNLVTVPLLKLSC